MSDVNQTTSAISSHNQIIDKLKNNIKSDSDVLYQQEEQLYTKSTINIDGVEKSALNSEDNPLGRTEQDIRNFWKWFGDSKVVDKNGNPLVVYHGTNTEFDTFEKQRISDYGKGYYFTTSKESAENYAKKISGNEIMPVYLKIIDIYETPGSSSQFLRNLSETKKYQQTKPKIT